MENTHPAFLLHRVSQHIDRLEQEKADLVATLKDVDKFYQDNIEIMPVAFQTIADIVETTLNDSKDDTLPDKAILLAALRPFANLFPDNFPLNDPLGKKLQSWAKTAREAIAKVTPNPIT